MYSDIKETKICKKCGEMLTLDKFPRRKNNYYRCVCRDCVNEQNREKRLQKKIEKGIVLYQNDNSMKIKRKYKKPYPFQLLDKSVSGIRNIARDEKFVRLFDYKNVWVSNCGRVIQKSDDGTYNLLKGVFSRKTKELTYTLDRNVYFKSKKKWGYRKEKVTAASLVIQMFIVNYDMKNNTKCWHKDNDTKDNYYKHLFPVTDKQYDEILRIHEQEGAITDKQILAIINAAEFKQDNWNPWVYKRTYQGIGYLGTDNVDYSSDSYIRWMNMVQRCYSERVHQLKPYYKDKNTCIEWQNYQNYKMWYDAHYVPGIKVDLDKDLLCKESNMYSPETCVFITHFLNTVFEDRGIKSNIAKDDDGKYTVSMSILNKRIPLGEFDSEKEAQTGLIKGKINYVNELAEKCKGSVPDYVYDAMKNWKFKVA